MDKEREAFETACPDAELQWNDEQGCYEDIATRWIFTGFLAGARWMQGEAVRQCETHYHDRDRPDFTRDPYITTLQCAAKVRALLPEIKEPNA